MTERKFYYIEEMSAILGKSIAGIYGHLARKQYDAVPPPMKLGRRLAWHIQAVDDWIEVKLSLAKVEAEKYKEFIQAPPRRRGRPTKTEEIKRRKEDEVRGILQSLSQGLENENDIVHE